ncbi:MAG: tetratricopeptide repeat protein [Longimicrobiales bacterium]
MSIKRVLEELKRRRVFRVAAIYGVVGYGAVQVANNFFPTLNLPAWTTTFVAALVVLGFPVALALAWAFDITPAGLTRTEPVTTPTARSSPARRIFMLWAAVAAVVLVYAAALRFLPDLPSLRGEAGRRPASIAVLPFENIGGDPENEYFSDGITEDVIAQLTKLGDLKVISRTSVMTYKDASKPTRQIADELGVATILDGTVRRSEGRVRVVAQLVDARSDEQLWADTYDRDLRDIFAIQSDISQRIARALQTQLSTDDRARLERRPTEDLKAYDLYMRGRYFWNKRSSEGLQRAAEFFQQAIARDSSFALAFAGLADVYAILPSYQRQPPSDEHARARAAATRALAIDPQLGEAHAALGYVSWYEWDWDTADREFRQAIDFNPGYATAHQWYGLFLAAWNRVPDGEARMARAAQLDPLSLIINAELGLVRFFARRYDDAIAQLHRTLEMDSTFGQAWAFLVPTYATAGHYDEALDAFLRFGALQGLPAETAARARREFDVQPTRAKYYRLMLALGPGPEEGGAAVRASAHASLGDKEAAFKDLERAFQSKEALLALVAVIPEFDPLRDDPRFDALLRKMNLRKPTTP